MIDVPAGSFSLYLVACIALLAVVWTAVVALWHWRQSKVDLVALEERIQAKRAKDPRYQVEGLTEAEIVDLQHRKPGLMGKLAGRTKA